MIELIQFPWSPFCIVQRRILEFAGARFKLVNIPNTDRSLVWKVTRGRYYQVPVLKDGRTVVGLDPVIEMLALSPVRDRVVAVGESLPFRDGSFDGVFSAYVFRNLSSVDETMSEMARVLKPGSSAVVADLSRPRNRLLRLAHRVGTGLLLPVVGLVFAGAPREYWYLHRSLDLLPPPERLFAAGPLELERTWRMGLFGSIQMGGGTLRAMQIGLHVVGNNIANANTPGYIRQEAIFVPGPVQKHGHLILGTGVLVDSIVQKLDRFVLDRLIGARGVRP